MSSKLARNFIKSSSNFLLHMSLYSTRRLASLIHRSTNAPASQGTTVTTGPKLSTLFPVETHLL